MDQEFVDQFAKVIEENIIERFNELRLIYNDDTNKILDIIKEEHKNICDIKIAN